MSDRAGLRPGMRCCSRRGDRKPLYFSIQSRGGGVGGPVKRVAFPCASTALPCGIEAILAMIWPPGGGYSAQVGRAGLCDPHARLQVQCASRLVIIDFLQVTQSEQLDVVLPEAPVRYRGSDWRDRDCLASLVELADTGSPCRGSRAGRSG